MEKESTESATGSSSEYLPTGVERRRAPPRIYSVFVVIVVGVMLNTILWLTGNATEYEYLPITLGLAAVVLMVHLVTDRRKAGNVAAAFVRKIFSR
jgi:hypothetical protein